MFFQTLGHTNKLLAVHEGRVVPTAAAQVRR